MGRIETEDGLRRSTRGLEDRIASEGNAAGRAQRQKELMAKKIAEAKRRLEVAANGGVDFEDVYRE